MGKLKAFQATERYYCWSGSLFPRTWGLAQHGLVYVLLHELFPAYVGISPSAPTVYPFFLYMWG